MHMGVSMFILSKIYIDDTAKLLEIIHSVDLKLIFFTTFISAIMVLDYLIVVNIMTVQF